MELRNGRIIAAFSQACLDEFAKDLSTYNEIPSPLPPNNDLLRHYMKRFDIWVDWSGALARDGYSLDDRLKTHGDIVRTFTDLLEMIHKSIIACRSK